MNKLSKSLRFIITGAFVLSFIGCSTTTNKNEIKGSSGPSLNQAELLIPSIPKDTPIHVHLFSIDTTALGTDTARTMAKSAPYLLATDIVQTLRESGFTHVTLDETEGGAVDGAINLVGSFNTLNPGSQNLRLWIGFGAGQSKVCVDGKLINAGGNVIGTFSHCENGIGWGESKPQLENEAHTIGAKIGHFIAGES